MLQTLLDLLLANYIFSHTNNLHKVQKKLIKYNEKLGHIKKLQISILQANFIQFIIKINNYKSYLEIGTFTGYSILSAALALPKNCKLIGIDKTICSELKIKLESNEIKNITFYTSPEGKVHPEDKLDPNLKLLEGFVWRINERPESLEDLFK